MFMIFGNINGNWVSGKKMILNHWMHGLKPENRTVDFTRLGG